VRILIASHVFAPGIGGIETVAALLARGLEARGHRVRILTNTPSNGSGDGPGTVIRRPALLATLRSYLDSDAAILMGPTLQLGWPLLLMRRRALISHHAYAAPVGGSRGPGRLRRMLMGGTSHIACSRSVAESIGYPCVAVGNPYDDAVFKSDAAAVRDRELAFVGRLVPEKGGDVLLRALRILRSCGLAPRLTIVGDGSERAALEAQAKGSCLPGQAGFAGPVTGQWLAALLRRHQVLVVPSVWNEPFGIVALEGIACGCVIAGSSGGGLPEAIGPCGAVFPKGDAAALARLLEDLLRYPDKRQRLREGAAAHLRRHQIETVVRAYLEVLGGGRPRAPGDNL
jgi:glycogen synthase